jgi:hypothetical protein
MSKTETAMVVAVSNRVQPSGSASSGAAQHTVTGASAVAEPVGPVVLRTEVEDAQPVGEPHVTPVSAPPVMSEYV